MTDCVVQSVIFLSKYCPNTTLNYYQILLKIRIVSKRWYTALTLCKALFAKYLFVKVKKIVNLFPTRY